MSNYNYQPYPYNMPARQGAFPIFNSGMNIVNQSYNNPRGGYYPQGQDMRNRYQPELMNSSGRDYSNQRQEQVRSMNGGEQRDLGRLNHGSQFGRQNDFDRKSMEYNNSIISSSNEIRAREENVRNIDRLNKINSEINKQNYLQQMQQLKQSQVQLSAAKNSNNIYDKLLPQQNYPNNILVDNNNKKLSQSALNNDREEYNRPSRKVFSQRQEPLPSSIFNAQRSAGQLPYSQPYQIPLQGSMGNFPPRSEMAGGFGVPPLLAPQNSYSLGNPFYSPSLPLPIANQYSSNYDKTSKPIKEISKAIEKQNEVMKQLMNKLNNPHDETKTKRESEEVTKYMKLFNQINDLREQSIKQTSPLPQIRYENNPNSNSNMMIQLIFQQQMMQSLMYNKAMQDKYKAQEENNKPQLSALDLLKKQEREEALENKIKQLILAKGGNIEELQAKLDKIAGIVRKPVKVEEDSEEEDDEDDSEGDEEDDDDDDDLDGAEKEAERKKKLAKQARQKVRRAAYAIEVAQQMIKNLKIREEEKKKEVSENFKIMKQLCYKTGLIWAVSACEKGFAAIKAKPKENLDIINDVDKLKTNILEERINSICNLTQVTVDGIFESLSTLPKEISRYSAGFYQEKCYLPNGVISQFEIDRLEFNQTFGYIMNVNNERKCMLTGIQVLVEILIIVALAKPWEYQMSDKKLANEPFTKQKLLTIASIIYHIYFDYLKKEVQPIQNNITKIPESLKPQHRQDPLLYELGVKNITDKGTRYILASGLIEYNSLLVIWTQKSQWKDQLLEKIKQIIQFIVDKANAINEEATNIEKQEYIKAAQEDQLLLPEHIRKTNF